MGFFTGARRSSSSSPTSSAPAATPVQPAVSKASLVGNQGWLAMLGFGRGEGDSATTSESTAASAPATDPHLQSGLDKVDRMISGGSKLYPQASANLQQWRDALGDRVMPAEAFTGSSKFMRHLSGVHREKFIEGAKKRLADGRLADGGSVEMDWTDSMYASPLTDLFFALGGFTVHSHVSAQAAMQADGTYQITFGAWQTDVSDTYDWDAGKSTMIPGVGEVTDDEMLALEKAGYGQAFEVTSSFPITDEEVTGPASVPAP